jgi:transposase
MMGKARSDDLRERVVEAAASGMSRRGAAARFQVSAASAVRWVALKAETGGVGQRLLDERGLATTETSIRRFFKRRRISFKKNPARQRADAAEARALWKASQAELDPARLVFIDETGTNTKMVRRYGRSPRGRRALGRQPFGHWQTTTRPAP